MYTITDYFRTTFTEKRPNRRNLSRGQTLIDDQTSQGYKYRHSGDLSKNRKPKDKEEDDLFLLWIKDLTLVVIQVYL